MGCAQLAGIDETSGPAGDGGDGPPPGQVQLSWERISLGTTVERSPMDLTGQTASYLVPSAAAAMGFERVMPALQGSTWVSDLTMPAPIEFTLPDYPAPLTRIWDVDVPALTGGYVVLEHPDPQPPPEGATLAMAVTSDVAFTGAEAYQLFTVGAWTQRGLAPPALAGEVTLDPTPFPYSTTSSIGGRPHIALSPADAVFVLRYAGNQLQAVLEAPPFAQTAADTITGALTPIALDQSLGITFDYATIAARFGVVSPAPAAPNMAMYLRAAPGGALGSDTGIQLDAIGVGPETVNPIASTYGNPFAARGWPTTMTLVATASRTYTPPSLPFPVGLASQLVEVAAPVSGMTASFAAGFPTRIAIGGTLLTIDGVEVTQPTQPVDVTFLTSSTANTYYAMNLFEVAANATGDGAVRNFVVQIVSREQRFSIPPQYLAAGKLYNVRVFVHQGFATGASTGDLRPNSPGSQAWHDSGVFRVVP